MMKQTLFFLFIILLSQTALFGQWTNSNYELNLAAYEGDTAKVDSLIEAGVNVDLPDFDGVTALVYAAQNGHIAVAKRLLDKEAQIDHLTWDFRTPLLAAVMENQFEMAEFLIRSGAKINAKDNLGASSLHYAVAYGNFYMADMLVYYEIDLEAKDEDGHTPLSIAATLDYDTIAWMLLENNCQVDPIDTFGNTPMLSACENGHFNVVKLLVENGADIHHINNNGFNALQIAVYYGYNDIVSFLISQGLDPQRPDAKSIAPIITAKSRGLYSTVQLLKEAGAKPIRKPLIDAYSIKIENSFSTKDYFLGGSLGTHDLFTGCYLNLGYQGRIGQTPILFREQENLFYQYYEKRHQIYLGLERKIVFNPRGNNPKGLLLGLREVFTFGKYRGTVLKLDRKVVTSPTASLFIQKRFFTFSIEYQYLDFKVEGLSPHRINLNMAFDINILQPKYRAGTIEWL
ncbi:MAG: ankyrin repeat domain-containing protein [Bacteroidales bacterium]|nr:ankyrin repeat domain-containing protein [Bacteroidales bacterium]MCF8454632.1 ankyrin repeat domain-containing protein [Bacteroidales bacterium]